MQSKNGERIAIIAHHLQSRAFFIFNKILTIIIDWKKHNITTQN